MNRFLSILAALTLASCTAPERTVETLQKSGYSNVQPGGYSFFGCGEGDHYHTEFTATNPAGQRVSGVVCCGWIFKGCTIRF